MNNILIVIQYVCIVGLMTEGWIVFRKWTCRLHAYLFFSIAVNLVNTVGYLFELTAQSEEAYLTALKLSYFGRVWTAFALVLFVTELCGAKMPEIVTIAVALFNIVTFVIVLTTPAHELYYKNISFTVNDGRLVMEHESGIWHNVYSVMLAVIIFSALTELFFKKRKEHDRTAKKRLNIVFAAMVTETLFFLVQIFIKTPRTNVYDLTMPGYMLGTLLMLIAILRYDLLGTGELAREFMKDRLSEGIIAVDDHGTVQYFNEPAKKLYPDLKLSSGAVPARITDALASGSTIIIDDRIYTPEETALVRNGESRGKLYALIDDTEHYQYMRELEKQKSIADSANQAKSAFPANMSHDIRTPINAVLGMNEMILRECGDEHIVGCSEKIRSAGNTLLGLINDILDMNERGGAIVWKNMDKLWNVPAAPDAEETEETGETQLPAEGQLPALLDDIGEIDINSGLLHCGTAETYLEALAVYAKSVPAQCDETERCRAAGDIRNMTVRIHAIKSTSRVIGAMELGDLAEKLEAAGHAEDTEFLGAHTDELLARCRRLSEQLSPLNGTEELPLIPEEELSEAFTLIREFLSVEDYEKFYRCALEDIGKASQTREYLLDAADHPNWFDASYISWLSYDSLNVELPDGYLYFLPIVNWGRYWEENGRLMMPVTVRLNHAAADGFLLANVFRLLEKEMKIFVDNEGRTDEQ